jgi:hypothetical protein
MVQPTHPRQSYKCAMTCFPSFDQPHVGFSIASKPIDWAANSGRPAAGLFMTTGPWKSMAVWSNNSSGHAIAGFSPLMRSRRFPV